MHIIPDLHKEEHRLYLINVSLLHP